MVVILEDDAVLADLAAELCVGLGLHLDAYPTPAPFLDAVRADPPAALVLDWRLQDQLGAAAFMAVRHRHPELPVVCWTASPAWRLPQMIRHDPMTQVVDKAAGAMASSRRCAGPWPRGSRAASGRSWKCPTSSASRVRSTRTSRRA